jgi:hypothetical protein
LEKTVRKDLNDEIPGYFLKNIELKTRRSIDKAS